MPYCFIVAVFLCFVFSVFFFFFFLLTKATKIHCLIKILLFCKHVGNSLKIQILLLLIIYARAIPFFIFIINANVRLE